MNAIKTIRLLPAKTLVKKWEILRNSITNLCNGDGCNIMMEARRFELLTLCLQSNKPYTSHNLTKPYKPLYNKAF